VIITINGEELDVKEKDDIIVLRYFNEDEKKIYYAIEQYRKGELIFKNGEA